MSKQQLFIFGLCLSAAVVLAQTLPPTLPSAANRPGYVRGVSAVQPVRRTSHLNGKEYLSILKPPTASHGWEPSATLPLAPSAAERSARLELSKIVPDDSEWAVTDFQISRFGAGPDWYYAVTFQPVVQLAGEPTETFTALVDLAGMPGRVFQLGPQR